MSKKNSTLILEKIKSILSDETNNWTSLGVVSLEFGAVVICDPLSDYSSRNRVQRSVPAG
jgi:hypothetical protein